MEVEKCELPSLHLFLLSSNRMYDLLSIVYD